MVRARIRLEGWTHRSANLPPYGGEVYVWILEMAKHPENLECPQQFRPKLIVGIAVAKIRPKIRPKICPKIRPKTPSGNPSKKTIQKLRPSLSFSICDCPGLFCQSRPLLKTSTSNLNVFMSSMAMPHEGRLQFYICSKDGQIETRK